MDGQRSVFSLDRDTMLANEVATLAFVHVFDLYCSLSEESQRVCDMELRELAALDAVCQAGQAGLTAKAVSAMFGESFDTAADVLSKAETANLCFRIRSRQDRRMHAFCATSAGHMLDRVGLEALSVRLRVLLGGTEDMLLSLSSSFALVLGMQEDSDSLRDIVRFINCFHVGMRRAADCVGLPIAACLLLAHSCSYKSGYDTQVDRRLPMRRSTILALVPLLETLGYVHPGVESEGSSLDAPLFVTERGISAVQEFSKELSQLVDASCVEERAELLARLFAVFAVVEGQRKFR